jgi:hypothetical protein
MLGPIGHFGLQACPEADQNRSGAEYDNKELVPGLWHYEDGYDEDAEYEKIIEALRPKRQQAYWDQPSQLATSHSTHIYDPGTLMLIIRSCY